MYYEFCVYLQESTKRISEKIDVFFMDFDYVQSVVMLEEESTPGRGPSKVSVLVEGATQG